MERNVPHGEHFIECYLKNQPTETDADKNFGTIELQQPNHLLSNTFALQKAHKPI